MTPVCPTCRYPLVFDAYGRSTCGHIVPPPAPPPAPGQPQPTWGQPTWGQPPQAYNAPQGWSTAAPKRRRGRGCGCVLAAFVLLAAAAIGILLLAGTTTPQTAPPTTVPSGTVTPLAGTTTAGTAKTIATTTVAPGRAAVITTPAITLNVPVGAYEAPIDFAIATAPLTVKGYGGNVTAISPLFIVDGGGGYSATPMTLTVPVEIPNGSFAMGFYRHDDGTLEAMPLLAESADSITIATRHFSAFFIALVAEAALSADIGTGFRAGEDDFSFPNYGTYASSWGQCAGQSLTAMWYFLERRAQGAPKLFNRFDNSGRKPPTPSFWQDDATGWRLASSVQEDLDWDTLSRTVERAVAKANLDRLQWFAFRYAMLVTGAPQYVGLSEAGSTVGHAVVAYAATETGLWVADPNFPGELRVIVWDATAREFKPYDSGPTAAESDAHYDRIALYGKTALVDWAQIGVRWADAEAGRAGDGRFPRGSLRIAMPDATGKQAWQPMADGIVLTDTYAPRLSFTALGSGAKLRATIYVGTTQVGLLEDGLPAVVAFAEGRNDIGVYVEGFIRDEWLAVDFARYTVTTPGSTPDPDPTDTPEPTAAEATPSESAYDCNRTPPPTQIGQMEYYLHCQYISPSP